MPGNSFFFKCSYKHKGNVMNGILCNEEIQVLSSAEVLTCLGHYKNENLLSLMRHLILIFRLQSFSHWFKPVWIWVLLLWTKLVAQHFIKSRDEHEGKNLMRDVCEETTSISGRPISINNLEGYLRINNILIRSADAAQSLCHKDHTYKVCC